jgi:ubiquinone biosynthesis protein UbiJ
LNLPAVALAAIETMFNKIIMDQPDIVSDKLDNKCICLHLDGIGLPLYFHFTNNSVFLLDECQRPVDATIQGTPLALAAVSMSGSANTRDMKIDGDLQVVQAFERLLKEIDIDWEEIISHYTGDAIAFQVGKLARGFKKWGEQSRNAFADDLRDYLQIETRQLPLPAEVELFNNSVDEVRAAVERFEMRLQRFESNLSTREASTS